MWVIAVAAGLLLWLAAFSWWAPGPFFPVMAVVIILVVVFGRRGQNADAAQPPAAADSSGRSDPADTGPASQTVRLDKDVPADAADRAGPTWVADSRRWLAESREARNDAAAARVPGQGRHAWRSSRPRC